MLFRIGCIHANVEPIVLLILEYNNDSQLIIDLVNLLLGKFITLNRSNIFRLKLIQWIMNGKVLPRIMLSILYFRLYASVSSLSLFLCSLQMYFLILLQGNFFVCTFFLLHVGVLSVNNATLL